MYNIITMFKTTDRDILRELAYKYMEISGDKKENAKRDLWRAHLSRKSCETPILADYGMWNVWCKEVFADSQMKCEDQFCKGIERNLRMSLLHDYVGDDTILEPWYIVGAKNHPDNGNIWGLDLSLQGDVEMGGALHYGAPLKDLTNYLEKVEPVEHYIDEEKTSENYEKTISLIGDIIPVYINRMPVFMNFSGDIATDLCKMRGLEQIMIDMYEDPENLHALCNFMGKHIKSQHDKAESNGDFSFCSYTTQETPYCDILKDPTPSPKSFKRKDLWYFCAAQEFALISPEMHDEFLFQYQLPIMDEWGAVSYGCCEDLTKKIDMLRQSKNLQSIAISPRADVARCAEQIGADYAMSYRPNPADVICCGFDEDKIKNILSDAVSNMEDNYCHIHLKDIETVEGEINRLKRFTSIAKMVTGR